MHDYSVTLATLNCLNYTKLCLESLIQSGVKTDQIIVVDNFSSDGTQDFLRQSDLKHIVFNRFNLSCGAAWNQGILMRQSEWTIVMNNDLVVSRDFAEKLIDYAIENDLKMISPALIDGDLDYDFEKFSIEASAKMNTSMRLYSSHAVCMCIHWSVFMDAGFFRVNPNLLGFEDAIFFNDIRQRRIKHGTTGSVWLHHFGSVTQEHMKLERGIPNGSVLVKVNDRKLLNQSWLERKKLRHQLKAAEKAWYQSEMKEYGMTLHGVRKNQAFEWM